MGDQRRFREIFGVAVGQKMIWKELFLNADAVEPVGDGF